MKTEGQFVFNSPFGTRLNTSVGANSFYSRCLLACACGAFSVLSWEPWGWWPLLIITYALFYFSLAAAGSHRETVFIALLFSTFQHTIGNGWVFGALFDKLALGLLFSIVGTAVFVVYLCLFVSLPAYVWSRFFQARRQSSSLDAGRPFSFPAATLAALMTLGEWARAQFFNGFTSLSAGYAAMESPLAGFIPITGIYGVSFLLYFFAFLFAAATIDASNRRYRRIMAVFMLAGVSFVAGWAAGLLQWVENSGSPKTFRLIQFNIHQQQKFDPNFIPGQIASLTEILIGRPADVVVTPEIAFPVFFHQLPNGIMERLKSFSKNSKTHLMLGVATMASNSGYNSVLHISPVTDSFALINKTYLMPFGEYSPKGFGWFADSLPIPLKDLSPGKPGQKPFMVDGVGFGALICHEDLVGDLNRIWADQVGVIVNPSNLGWFERSLAIPQRTQIVRARALEIGRPILRVANTGVTASIDHRGKVLQQLAIEVQGELSGFVQPTRGRTPFVFYGDRLAVVGCVLVLLVVLRQRSRQH